MNSVIKIFSVFLLSAFVMCVSASGTNIVFAGVETGVDIGAEGGSI